MISMIAAYGKGRVIGKNGQMPWHLPNDLAFFKRVTSGHTVVMGRKTFESIGRPLPNRRNIVLTTSADFHASGVEVVHSKAEVLALGEDVFIIGGAQVYAQFLPEADRLYITEIDAEFDGGDAFFPTWNRELYDLIERVPGKLDENNSLPHVFCTYQRKDG